MTPQRRTALVSIGAAAVLAAVKLGAGLVSGSLGLDLGGTALRDGSRRRSADVLRDRRLRTAGRRRAPVRARQGGASGCAGGGDCACARQRPRRCARGDATDGNDEPRGRHSVVALRGRGGRALDRPLPHGRLAAHGAALRQRGTALECDSLRQRLRRDARGACAVSPRRRPAIPGATRSQRSSSLLSSCLPPAG